LKINLIPYELEDLVILSTGKVLLGEAIELTPDEVDEFCEYIISKGGKGSGNFDHEGIPGHVGGSSAGSGNNKSNKKESGVNTSRRDHIKISGSKDINAINDMIKNGNYTKESAEETYKTFHKGYGASGTQYRDIITGVNKRGQDLLENYIDKMPKYEGTIYRGLFLSKTSKTKLVTGGAFSMTGISSWSSNESTAKQFSEKSGYLRSGVNLIFVLEKHSKAVSVSHMSNVTSEKEVLVSGRTKNFKINKIENGEDINGKATKYVHVSEI